MNSSYLEGNFMISAGDIRKGTTFEHEGQVFTVIEFLLISDIYIIFLFGDLNKTYE